MADIYVSWVKWIVQDKEALSILRNSGVVSGIEMSNTGDDIDRVHDAGLKVSSHISRIAGSGLAPNFANPNYVGAFSGEQGDILMRAIRESDAATVGFHLGYSAEAVYEMQAYPNVPKAGTIITNREALLDRIVGNVVLLEVGINKSLPSSSQKQVVIETLDYCRKMPIPWDKEIRHFSDEERAEIEKVVAEQGVNAALLYVTEPAFVKAVLDRSAPNNIRPIGFLFDVAHNFISVDAKMNEGSFTGSVEEYFDNMLAASSDRTYQLHLNVPVGDSVSGYLDHHEVFRPSFKLSDQMIELAKTVVQRSPHICTVTLEMWTGKGPVEHAREMVQQAEYVLKSLEVK